MRTVRAALLLALGGSLLGGCLEERRYITGPGGGPITFALDEDTPAFLAGEDASVYLVEERILFELDVPPEEALARLPEETERLRAEGLQFPYPVVPYLRRGDLEVQVDFTLSSLADRPVEVDVTLNGINEFHEYEPEVTLVEDDVVVDFAQWERDFRLEPGERVTRTVREEELDEVAVDLATVVNGERDPSVPINPNQIVFFQNQSDRDPRSQRFIPDVIPALTGLRVGLRSEAPVPVVVEVLVRVRDVRGVLYGGGGEGPWTLPPPAPFSPADAAPATMPPP